MKFELLLVVCLAPCVLEAFRRSLPPSGWANKRYGNGRFTQKFPRVDDAAAARDGVLIPDDSCVMTWEEFDTLIVGRPWIAIYSIDDDFSLNPEEAKKFKGFWSRNGTNVRRQASTWLEPNDQCVVVDGQFAPASPTLAKTTLISSTAFGTEDRVDYFVSCSPGDFFIFFICYVRPMGKRCPVSETFLMVPEQRPLHPDGDFRREGDILINDLPWSKVELNFKRCFGQVFVDRFDPQLKWAWTSTECPDPRSEEGKQFAV